MKSSWTGIGFSHHSVRSVSNTAIRSSTGTPSASVCSTKSTIVFRTTPSRQLDSAVIGAPTFRTHQRRRVHGRRSEICRLPVGTMEPGNHETGAEVAELLLVRRAPRHNRRRIHPEQVLLPRSRATAEREHVVDPRAMTTNPV